MSLDLYISESSLVIGTFPMVFLKNTSSIVDGLIERKAGKSNRSFPKRQGCVGYLGDREKKNSVEVLKYFFKGRILFYRKTPIFTKLHRWCYLCQNPVFCTCVSKEVESKENSPWQSAEYRTRFLSFV